MQNPIIIGAGVSGLVAAIELEKAGYSPTLIEASDRIGGRVKSDVVNGVPLDHGFQVLLSEYPEAKRYLDYEKLDLIRFAPGSVIFQDGKQYTIGDPLRDTSFLWSTLNANIGSIKDKLLILKLANRVKKKSIDQIFASKEQSTGSYLKDFGFSDKIITQFFQPFFAGIFLEEELVTSSRMFEFVYKMFGTGDATIPREGMQAIPNQLASQLTKTTIRLNTKVRTVENKTIHLDNGEVIESDHIIITTDPSSLIKSTSTQTLTWKSCYNIYLEAKQSALNKTLIGLLPDTNLLVNNFHYLEDVFGKSDSKTILSVTVVKDHNLSESAMIEKVKKELFDHCNINTGETIKVYHIKQALPHRDSLMYEPSPDSMILSEGIYCCGDYLANGSLNSAMASGRGVVVEMLK